MEAPATLAPCAGSTLPGRMSSLTLATTRTGGTRMANWPWPPPWKWIHLPDFLISIRMAISAFLISLKCHDEVICCDVISNLRLRVKMCFISHVKPADLIFQHFEPSHCLKTTL